MILFSTLIALCLVESGSWVWVNVIRDNQLSRWEFRATQPEPYRSADYFNAQFLRESETFVNGRITDVVELEDFEGRYFNVQGGFRVTSDLPEKAQRRVLLFGGSTLFGQEVPDHLTIASYLQRMLIDSGQLWSVHNYGLPGMNASQQVMIMNSIPLQSGDIVIFYHGVNDIYYVVFGGAAGGWKAGVPNFRPIQKLSPLAKWMSRWHNRLKHYSSTADVALDIFDRSTPLTISDQATLTKGIDSSVREFSLAIKTGYKLAQKSNAEFIHYLQPTIFEMTEKSSYEEGLLNNYLETPPGIDVAFDRGYPKLRDVSFALVSEGISFSDLSDALEGRHAHGEVFLDFCHINHVGNRLIAERILDDLLTSPTQKGR